MKVTIFAGRANNEIIRIVDNRMDSEHTGLREFRAQNIQMAQKQIQRLLSLIYVLFVLIVVAWFASNFESTELSGTISELDKALEIEELRNWDNYLYQVSSCFDQFFFGFDGALVDKARFKLYIDQYTKENEEFAPFIDKGQQSRYPTDELRALYNSDKHWSDHRFWSQQDTLVSFLFSLEYIVGNYRFASWSERFGRASPGFSDTLKTINAAADSTLVHLSLKLDSLKSPFDYAIKVGWNPFTQGDNQHFAMWGRAYDFDQYSDWELAERINFLHRLNIVSYFKTFFKENRSFLELVATDLERISYRGIMKDSIRFSKEVTDIKFFDLKFMFASKLWDRTDLPDSIQVKRVLDWSIEYENVSPRDSRIALRTFYPQFSMVLAKYKLDRISGIKNLKQILETQQRFGQQRLQAFGAEISYYTVLLLLPAIVLALYLLTCIFVYHLHEITTNVPDSIAADEITELCNAPSLIMLKPVFLAIGLTTLPGVIIAFIIADQLGIVGNRSPFANLYFVIFYFAVTLAALFWLATSVSGIHKNLFRPPICEPREPDVPHKDVTEKPKTA